MIPSLQGAAPDTAMPATAEELADALCGALARGHNIPAYPVALGSFTVVSIWYGLTARCQGGRIWWTRPRRDREVLTFAYSPTVAAARLAQLYAAVVHRDGPTLGLSAGVGPAGLARSVEAAAADQLAARERP
ncbi:hypothetical protein AB0F17_65675 [Nonomuraea sp. NPDC026600]|uniref:hypothetical protein n=1 Tax=Nonomuraea sp. NPDC026600 TaxID=3155363 RepID=UPI0033CB43E5